jgi:hypothetical protein
MSVAPGKRERLVEPLETTGVVVVEEMVGLPQGTAIDHGESDRPFAFQVDSSETLAGPRGVHETRWHPGTVTGDDLDRWGIKVFAPYEDGLRVAAVLAQNYDDPPSADLLRIDLPESTSDETWEYLALTHDGVAVSRSSRSEDVTDVLVVRADGGDPRLLHTLPLDAQIVMPGAVVGDQ